MPRLVAPAFVSALAFGLTGSTVAEWPTEPATPLHLGLIQGAGSAELGLVTTPDGATWVSWVDGQCFPSLRVQRIAPDGSLLVPGGLMLDHVDDGCPLLLPRMTACADSTVVVSGVGGSGLESPVNRIAPDGTLLWTPEVVGADFSNASVGQLLGMPDGDVLVFGQDWTTMLVGRYAPGGTNVWGVPATFELFSGPNLRMFALVPDGAGGAFAVWDQPASYERRIYAMHISSAGVPLWPEQLTVLNAFPDGSSLHTPSQAVSDGHGGFVVLWTHGEEQSSIPVPLLMQRVNGQGDLLLPAVGVRVSTEVTRQFDGVIRRDDVSGDFFIAWRDGFADMQLKVQRMSSDGDRLWGDFGVDVTDMNLGSSHFDGVWRGDEFVLAVADDPSDPTNAHVRVQRVDGDGVVDSVVTPISGTVDAPGAVHIASLPGDAHVVTWFEDPAGVFDDAVVAQRVNADGTLGLLVGDLDGDGIIGFSDLVALLAQWGPCVPPCPGDLDGDGNVGFGDLLILLTSWS